MLPSSKNYLMKGGLSPEAAAYTIIGCFLGGVVGIQLISRVMHHFIPSHVVDCDHTHEGHDDDSSEENTDRSPSQRPNGHTEMRKASFSEATPLLSREISDTKTTDHLTSGWTQGEAGRKTSAASDVASTRQRPNLQSRLTGLIAGRKTSCAQDGPCLGYTDPCAQECFKNINRSPTRHSTRAPHRGFRRGPGLLRTSTAPHFGATDNHTDQNSETESQKHTKLKSQFEQIKHQKPSRGRHEHRQSNGKGVHSPSAHASHDLESQHDHQQGGNPPHEPSQSHHHHVPSNAFLSIGLQTSIAIALHKLPEGFITYATNHANPKLGFSVFMALFIHNITEGFAMALPLYLAINSRSQAMFWSSLLGGASQPLGAGIAALWFKAAGSGSSAPGETVYGCMFGITAGIMASVALQLFSESLTMTHNRNLCIASAFVGMGILGISFALTAS